MKLTSLNIETLPSSLYEAINELKANKLMQETLGDHLYNRYSYIKTKEWNEFKMQVALWEIDKYLDI